MLLAAHFPFLRILPGGDFLVHFWTGNDAANYLTELNGFGCALRTNGEHFVRLFFPLKFTTLSFNDLCCLHCFAVGC